MTVKLDWSKVAVRAGTTLSVIVAVSGPSETDELAGVPVMVIVPPPGGVATAALDATSCNCVEVPVVTVVGVKTALTPLGRPLAEKVIVPVDPNSRASVRLSLTEPLTPTVTELCAGVIVKLG